MAHKDRKLVPDVPYHLTFATYEKDDTMVEPLKRKRRHKSRCIHYQQETDRCLAATSGCYNVKCHGSNQCAYYAESLAKCKKSEFTYYRYRDDEDDGYMRKLKKEVEKRNFVKQIENDKRLAKRTQEREMILKKKEIKQRKEEEKLAQWRANRLGIRKQQGEKIPHDEIKKDANKISKNLNVKDNVKMVPTEFQLTCKFFFEGECSILGKQCEMRKSCLFRDNTR